MPVPHGTFADIQKSIEAPAAVDAAAPAQEVAPAAQEPVAEASAEATPAMEQSTAAAADAPAPEKTPQRVSWTKYESTRIAQRDAEARLAESQATIAQLQAQLANQVVSADPKAAAPQAGESEQHWIDRMLEEGEEINPKLAAHIKSLEEKIADLAGSVTDHKQRWGSVQEAQINQEYDARFAELKAATPKWSDERLTTMLAEGVKPRMIVAIYRDSMGGADAAAPQVAAAPAAARSAPPRLDAPNTAGRASDSDGPLSMKDYAKWARDEFASTRH